MVYNYDWSSIYAGAVLESDQCKLSKRILEAELAILRRTREPGLARREWRAIRLRWVFCVTCDRGVTSHCTSIDIEAEDARS
jgi:hypothetical protein